VRPQDIEGLFALGMVALFVAAERMRPLRATNKKRDFRLDLAGFICIVLFGKFSRLLLHHWGVEVGDIYQATLSRVHSGYEILPSILRVSVAIIITDFILYWIHRFMHNPKFWRFHIWHHSTEELYWFSGFRASFFHTFLFLTPQVLLIYLLGLGVYEVLSAMLFGIFIQFWQHTNITFSFGFLDKWLMTPKYHFVHHAVEEQYRDKNFGTVLVIWDRIFGTYIDPKNVDAGVQLGLKKKKPVWQMIAGV